MGSKYGLKLIQTSLPTKQNVSRKTYPFSVAVIQGPGRVSEQFNREKTAVNDADSQRHPQVMRPQNLSNFLATTFKIIKSSGQIYGLKPTKCHTVEKL